jgi:hypothetical protein
MVDTVPPWLATMRAIKGTFEAPGSADNPVILSWSDTITRAFPDLASYARRYKHDSTAWCGHTLAYVMAANGIRPPYDPGDDLNSYLWVDAWDDWGTPVPRGQERLGDVLVFSSPHHITLYEGQEGGHYLGLGGNQSDSVRLSRYAKSGIKTIRRPPSPMASAELPPKPVEGDIILPPFDSQSQIGNPLLLLILVLIIRSKEKPMAGDSAKPSQGVDFGTVLLPLVLQSALTGKQIDTPDLLSVMLAGKPSALAAPTPTPIATPQQPTDINALLLPLLYQMLTGKSWPGPTPEPEKPQPTPKPSDTPAMSKPSVQLSVGGLALSTILQALGIVGTPFGTGTDPTPIGTLATLVPLATAAIGATGGFGALASIGLKLFGGFLGAARRQNG